MTDVTGGAGTANPSVGIHCSSCVQSLVFHVLFCRSLLVIIFLLFWPLYYLSFFDLPFVITHMIYSMFSYLANAGYAKYDRDLILTIF
jgi:positive regulator of sigma E activity